MDAFRMEHCTLQVSGNDVELLALVPIEPTELSSIVDTMDGYPFCEVLDEDELAQLTRGDLQHLRAYFPKLKRATLIFDKSTVLYALEGYPTKVEVEEDRELIPNEDVIFVSPNGEKNIGLLH